ncbi:MAG: serine O-acetyltransferase [Polyangiales bacterium]
MNQTTLPSLVDAMLESYREDPRGHHINKKFLPSRDEIIRCVQMLLQLFYPGYYGRQDLTDENVRFHVGCLLTELRATLAKQIELCLCHQAESCAGCTDSCHDEAARVTDALLAKLPSLRRTLLSDVQAAFDGDPAASGLDEVILAYPGLLAVSVYRVAHELYAMGVPLMPRIMSEWAHTNTGADIHPGAKIGASFFIDHATGIVVGETSDLGASVKLYQGVTLGALSHPKDDRGRVIRGTKRHPTVEDGATLYANATVLGGQTVVGEGSVIGGSVFLTKSVPKAAKVAMKPPELMVKSATEPQRSEPDFEI